uniref:Cinful1 polyprotein n=1 Tax=Zea mays TaxID=4577 RepID=Q8W1D4_MAIZE|nr:Cinful1 polyprotein [Zea mays]
MASFNNQARAASAPKLVLPITGGSCSERANKKQKKEAQRRVQHVGVQGPFIKSRWSHIPITFSQEDLQLKDYPHNDAMVISCVIKGFLVHNVLVDTGSAADIIFAKAFRQMQEPEDKIHDATHPLCGFGGRQIVALGKITMPITFGFINNTRTEQVVFDIVDMEYPYNAIIGRGTLNAFEAILHPAYLCMKIPSDQGPIAIHGSQEAARRAEGNWTDSKAIHNIDGAEASKAQLEADTKQAEAEATTIQAETEAGPSVPTEMERADPKEKSIERITTEKIEAPGPEASNKSIDYIIRHASGKVLSQEEMLEAQHYAQKLRYPKGALVFNGSGEEDFLYCLPDDKEISVCWEIGKSIGFPKLEDGLSIYRRTNLLTA